MSVTMNNSTGRASERSVVARLMPLLATVLLAFLVIGVALPVLPLHVRSLGYGPFIIGMVTGSQFAASLLSRVWSGRTCDNKGAKSAVIIGLAGTAIAGLLYLLSLRFTQQPELSVIILLAGRAVLGGAESFIITGATVWGLARVGNQNAGKVIAWMGTAMFAAFAAGAPLGIVLYDRGGFATVACATALAPLAMLLFIAPVAPVSPSPKRGPNMLAVIGKIWLPGLGAALSSVGFGVILTFGSLLFADRGWTPLWLAFTSYAVALIGARLLFGHLPDRVGGAKVAGVCVLVETAGLALMGQASSALLAAIGAALTGAGYALVFPGLGVEAVRRAPPESRGMAMGAYTACLDIALGVGGPFLGLIASVGGLGTAFSVSAIVVFCSGFVALHLATTSAAPAD